jgi:hypothetical protein
MACLLRRFSQTGLPQSGTPPEKLRILLLSDHGCMTATTHDTALPD